MIKEIKLQGFKSFRKANIPFKPLTLFSGLNSTGKSSVIQALRMFNRAAKGESPLLAGHGSVSDIRSQFVLPTQPVEIDCVFNTDSGMGLQYNLTLTDTTASVPDHFPFCFYVGADRLGPQTILPLKRVFSELPQLGERGEYVLGVLEQLRFGLIPEKLRHENATGKSLEFNLPGWLSEISPGVQLTFNTDQKTDSARAEIDSFRPTNVGFGLSYTLPVLVAVLGLSTETPSDGWGDEWGELWDSKRMQDGAMAIIENPEAHLHPQGQTAMGRMLALAASCGVQVVVETHSDHLMDGIRLAVKENLVDADDIAFHFLSKTEEGLSEITTPKLHQNGKLDFWPEGFFDQTLKNRAMLAKRSR